MASEVLNLARRIMGVQRNAVVVHKPCWEPTWCPEIQSVWKPVPQKPATLDSAGVYSRWADCQGRICKKVVSGSPKSQTGCPFRAINKSKRWSLL